LRQPIALVLNSAVIGTLASQQHNENDDRNRNSKQPKQDATTHFTLPANQLAPANNSQKKHSFPKGRAAVDKRRRGWPGKLRWQLACLRQVCRAAGRSLWRL